MNKLARNLLFILVFAIPQLSYADGCSLTKAVYDSGKYSQAFNTAKTYAQYGNACVEYYLAIMYINGQGVKSDSYKGEKLMASAAKKGYKPATDYYKNVRP